MSRVEREYQARIDAMTVAEKMQRSVAMLKWARDMIAREIMAENEGISWECSNVFPLESFQSTLAKIVNIFESLDIS